MVDHWLVHGQLVCGDGRGREAGLQCGSDAGGGGGPLHHRGRHAEPGRYQNHVRPRKMQTLAVPIPAPVRFIVLRLQVACYSNSDNNHC